MPLPTRPNPASFTPPLGRGSGLLPFTSAYGTALESWVTSWRSAQSSWVSEIRAAQAAVGYDSSQFQNAELQGIGSEKNFDYVARRWINDAGLYIVGKGETAKKVAQSSVYYQVKGLDEWLKKVDEEFRARVLEAMDRRVPAWLYRQVFHEKQTISYQGKKYNWERQGKGLPAKRVTTPETRTKVYTGWPVGSGFSRAKMALEWDNTGSDLKVRIICRAPYTLAAPVTRAAFNRLKRNLKDIIPGFTKDVLGDLEKERVPHG